MVPAQRDMAKAKKKSKGLAGNGDVVCTNPKATKQYEISERFEAGMVLAGSEVKSLRERRGDLEGAFANVSRGELWLHGLHIGAYAQATAYGHEARRSRKLLLKRHEIEKVHGLLTMKGFTLVPIKIYFKDGWAKVELGLGKGKKVADRRQDLRKKADMREARQHTAPKRKS